MGNELYADDGAGVVVVRIKSERIGEVADILLIEGAQAPENFTGVIRRFNPGTVLIVDAVDDGKTPGEIFWINVEDIDGFSASTHSLPLSMLAKFIQHEIECEIEILGIQVTQLTMGSTMSHPVKNAVSLITDELSIYVLD